MPERSRESPADPGRNSLAARPEIGPEEWATSVVQRGQLSLLLGRDGALTLVQTHDDGQTQMVRVPEEQLLAVAAAALGLTEFLSTRDADDQVISAMLLERYASGVGRDALPPHLGDELEALIDRNRDVARRIDVLTRPGRNDMRSERP